MKKHFFDIGFCLLLLAFIRLKLCDISLPYFWDELGVYAPGALRMKDAGTIGLLPADLEPLYSRGHPLLFVFCQASVFKFFGDGVLTGHLFSLFVSCLTLIALYLCVQSIFNKGAAFVSCILLVAQPVFYAMSCLILPEMMLTLFTILSVWSFVKRRWVWFAISAAMAIMTKESAIIIPATAMLFLFVEAIQKKDFFSLKRMGIFLATLVPLIVFGIFLLIQKKQNGWYFFPEHIGYIKLNAEFGDKLLDPLKDLFIRQGRWLPGVFFCIGLYKALRSGQNEAKRYFAFAGILIALAILSAALNFYLTRYMLYVVPFVIAGAFYGLNNIIINFNKPVFVSLICLFCITDIALCISGMNTKKFHDAADMGYKDLMLCEKDALHWAEQQPWRDSLIGTNFPVTQALTDLRYGCITTRPFRVTAEFANAPRYAILFYMANEKIPVNGARPYHVIRTFSRSYANFSIIVFD